MSKNAAVATTLTVEHIEAGYADDRWLGHGYLGGRAIETRTAAGRELVAAADALVLEVANAAGWTADELFDFVNSKHGRWVADTAFGGYAVESARKLIVKAF